VTYWVVLRGVFSANVKYIAYEFDSGRVPTVSLCLLRARIGLNIVQLMGRVAVRAVVILRCDRIGGDQAIGRR
jgi:hypothetical protein